MQSPLQLSFRGFEATPSLRADIEARAADLERFFDSITVVRVDVDRPHRHKEQGHVYHVHIDIGVPGDEIVVDREPEASERHSDPHVAIRDAFGKARRRLQDYARKVRGKVKAHDIHVDTGTVVQLFPTYGFIETFDGRELYFHHAAVAEGDYDQLEIGSRVTFSESVGEEGPLAKGIRLAEPVPS